MKVKGVSLVEVVCFAALVLVIAAIFTGRAGRTAPDGSICMAGYKWVEDRYGNVHQVIGEAGVPEKCVMP